MAHDPPTHTHNTIISEIYIILKLLLELEVDLSIRGPRLTPPAPNNSQINLVCASRRLTIWGQIWKCANVRGDICKRTFSEDPFPPHSCFLPVLGWWGHAFYSNPSLGGLGILGMPGRGRHNCILVTQLAGGTVGIPTQTYLSAGFWKNTRFCVSPKIIRATSKGKTGNGRRRVRTGETFLCFLLSPPPL